MIEFIEEEWGIIKDFDSYAISTHGRVFSYHTRQFLKPISTAVSGYCVSLWGPEGQRTKYIHRLVYEAFKPKPPGTTRKKIYHIDRDKSNNHVSNLSLENPRHKKRKH